MMHGQKNIKLIWDTFWSRQH